MFGGGPLGKQVGDVLVSANVTLFNLYGRCVVLFPLKHICNGHFFQHGSWGLELHCSRYEPVTLKDVNRTDVCLVDPLIIADFNIDWEYFRISDIAKVAFVPNEESKLELVVLVSPPNLLDKDPSYNLFPASIFSQAT